MAGNRLDVWATQTTTEDLSFSVSAGADRLLLCAVGCEDGSACNVTSMTYGGQTMFLVSDGATTAKGSATGGGSDTYLEIWGCLESEIAAASGTLIDVTMDNGAISEYLICAGSYENVDQSGNGGSGSVDFVQTGTTTGTAYSLTNNTVTSGGLAVFMGISRLSSTFTSTSPLIEIVDFTTGNASVGGGDDLIGVGSSTYTAAMTATANNRGVELFVSFAGLAVDPSADADITFDGIGFGSDASLLALGDADITLDDLAILSDASLAGLASANILLDGLTLTSDGDVATSIIGDLNSVFDALELSSDSAVLIQGDASNILDDAILSSDAGSEIQGSADNTLNALTLDSSVAVEIVAALDSAFEGVFLSADAALSSDAVSDIAFDELGLSSDGTVADGPQATLDVVFDDVGILADADAALSAGANITLDDLSLISDGAAADGPQAELIAAFEDASLSSDASAAIQGDAGIAFEDVGLTSDVTVLDVIQANLETTFNDLTLSADGSGDISGNAAFTLGSISINGEVSIDANAGLSITFDSLSLTSSGGKAFVDPFKIILSGKIDGVVSLPGSTGKDVAHGSINSASSSGDIKKTNLAGSINSITILKGGS